MANPNLPRNPKRAKPPPMTPQRQAPAQTTPVFRRPARMCRRPATMPPRRPRQMGTRRMDHRKVASRKTTTRRPLLTAKMRPVGRTSLQGVAGVI